jgi:hypothetical protein
MQNLEAQSSGGKRGRKCTCLRSVQENMEVKT